MSRPPLNDAQLDQLLRRELSPPHPSAQWRQRVLDATLRPAEQPFDAAARTAAMAEVRRRTEARIAAERASLLRRLLQYLLIAVSAAALVPWLAQHVQPTFAVASRVGVGGLPLLLTIAALAFGIGAGFSRQLRAMFGL